MLERAGLCDSAPRPNLPEVAPLPPNGRALSAAPAVVRALGPVALVSGAAGWARWPGSRRRRRPPRRARRGSSRGSSSACRPWTRSWSERRAQRATLGGELERCEREIGDLALAGRELGLLLAEQRLVKEGLDRRLREGRVALAQGAGAPRGPGALCLRARGAGVVCACSSTMAICRAWIGSWPTTVTSTASARPGWRRSGTRPWPWNGLAWEAVGGGRAADPVGRSEGGGAAAVDRRPGGAGRPDRRAGAGHRRPTRGDRQPSRRTPRPCAGSSPNWRGPPRSSPRPTCSRCHWPSARGSCPGPWRR